MSSFLLAMVSCQVAYGQPVPVDTFVCWSDDGVERELAGGIFSVALVGSAPDPRPQTEASGSVSRPNRFAPSLALKPSCLAMSHHGDALWVRTDRGPRAVRALNAGPAGGKLGGSCLSRSRWDTRDCADTRRYFSEAAMPCRPADGVVRVVGGEVSYVTTGRDLVLEPNGPRRTVVTLPDVIRGVWQGAAGGPVWVASGTETTWHFRRIRCAPQTLRMDDAIVRVHGPLASGYRCQEGDEDCDAVERAALLSKAPAARGLATILGGPSWHRAWDAHVLRLVADARGLDVDTAPEALVEALLHGADVLVRMYAPTISNTPVDPFRPSWLTALGHDDNATGGLRVVPIAAWYDEGLTRRPDWQVAWVVRDMHGESAVACPGQQVRLVLVKSFRRVRVVSDCMDVQ